MLITRKSMFSGKIRTVDLPITQAQIDHYNNGALLQDAFPNLSAADREFFKTGVTNEEWEETFSMEPLDSGEGVLVEYGKSFFDSQVSEASVRGINNTGVAQLAEQRANKPVGETESG